MHKRMRVIRLYLVDYHVHTKRCGHASGEDRDYIEHAIEKGLKEIGFADHVPQLNAYPEREEDLDEYVQLIMKLKQEYKEINIRIGLEVDYDLGHQIIEKISCKYPWDYLLGSIHVSWVRGNNDEEVFGNYFNLVAEAAESKLFNVIAHIDQVKSSFNHLPQEKMTNLYRQLAIRLGKAEAVIELNTSGLRGTKLGKVGIYPDTQLLELCFKQGVRVTLGSDAHKPSQIGGFFDELQRLMSSVGCNQIITFEKRQPKTIEIECNEQLSTS